MNPFRGCLFAVCHFLTVIGLVVSLLCMGLGRGDRGGPDLADSCLEFSLKVLAFPISTLAHPHLDRPGFLKLEIAVAFVNSLMRGLTFEWVLTRFHARLELHTDNDHTPE